MLKAAPHAAWSIAGPSGVALAAGLFGHLFLFDFVVDNMARGQLFFDIVYGNAHFYHQHHYMICQVGDLIDGFGFVVGLGGDDDFCGFFADFLQDLIYTFFKEVGGI